MRWTVVWLGFAIGCSVVADSGATGERCANLSDDDFDGRIDCADPDCSDSFACHSGVVVPPNLAGTCSGTWGSSRAGTYCQPWGPSDWVPCADDRYYRPTSSPGCIPVGDLRCRNPSALRPGDVFLDARADPGGDGSLTAPFADIDEALAAVARDGTVVFRGVIEVPRLEQQVNFTGVCPVDSMIEGGIEFDGADRSTVWLENLTLRADGRAALRVDLDGFAQLDQVVVHGGIDIRGGDVRVRRSSVVGPITAGEGFEDSGGTTRRSVAYLSIEESTIGAPFEQEEPCVSATDALVTIGETVFGRCGGGAAHVGANTSMFIEHCVFERLWGAGIVADGDSFTSVSDSLVRRSVANAEPAVRLLDGEARVVGTVFERGDAPAIVVRRGDMTVAEAALLDGGLRSTGGRVYIDRTLIDGFSDYALEVDGGAVQAEQVALRGGESSSGGVRAAAGTELTVDDFLFESVGECGFSLGPDVRLAVSNGTIVDSSAGFCIPSGEYPTSALHQSITQPTVERPVRFDER